MNPETLSGREAALRAVTAALTGDGFVVDKLAELRDTNRLEPREAGFARQIGLGAIRHAVTIDHVLGSVAQYDRRRVAAPLRALLYTAAYQMIWMERVPLFAAVDQAVHLAGVAAKRNASGMVNALLRRLAGRIASRRVSWRAGDPHLVRTDWDTASKFELPVLPSPENPKNGVAFLAAATGEHGSRMRELIEHYGRERGEQIAWASQAVPVTVVHGNPLRIDADAFAIQVHQQLSESADCIGDTAFLPASSRLIESEMFGAGMLHVQDSTARAAAMLVGARPGESVLDLCAAPGGKSIVIAQQMENSGRLVAADIDAGRLSHVRENADRLGLTCIETQLTDQIDCKEGRFDAAIVDVPCSNTGVIARRPEARFGFTTKKLESLVRLQRALLDKAAACVQGGGRLVYSTCSVEPQENEALIAAFIEANPAWSLASQETTLPDWGPRLSDWRDGGYAAGLTRDPAGGSF